MSYQCLLTNLAVFNNTKCYVSVYNCLTRKHTIIRILDRLNFLNDSGIISLISILNHSSGDDA